MFVPCIIRRGKTTNTCIELYHSFIQYTESYMFRQWSAIIRELLGFIWVTLNADRIGGISYNACLCGLCAGVLWLTKKLPDDGRPLPKHVWACILNKGVEQFSECVGCFVTFLVLIYHDNICYIFNCFKQRSYFVRILCVMKTWVL
jgi:hypothetical protein